MPIGLTNIGWKMYMVNGGWDVVIIVLIVCLTTRFRIAANKHRRYTGLKRRARLWKRLMRSLRARSIQMCRTSRKYGKAKHGSMSMLFKNNSIVLRLLERWNNQSLVLLRIVCWKAEAENPDNEAELCTCLNSVRAIYLRYFHPASVPWDPNESLPAALTDKRSQDSQVLRK